MLAIVGLLAVVAIILVVGGYSRLDHETDERITTNRRALVTGCERVNDVTVALKDVVKIATDGVAPGASERIDRLREKGEAIRLLDCSNVGSRP